MIRPTFGNQKSHSFNNVSISFLHHFHFLQIYLRDTLIQNVCSPFSNINLFACVIFFPSNWVSFEIRKEKELCNKRNENHLKDILHWYVLQTKRLLHAYRRLRDNVRYIFHLCLRYSLSYVETKNLSTFHYSIFLVVYILETEYLWLW